MGRLFFLLLVAAFITDGDLRRRVEPYTYWALDPVYEWSARYRLREISGFLASDIAAGHPAPSAAQVEGYLADRGLAGDAGRDAWGEPFYLERADGRLRFGSAGRDLTPHTGDDLHSAWVDPAAR